MPLEISWLDQRLHKLDDHHQHKDMFNFSFSEFFFLCKVKHFAIHNLKINIKFYNNKHIKNHVQKWLFYFNNNRKLRHMKSQTNKKRNVNQHWFYFCHEVHMMNMNLFNVLTQNFMVMFTTFAWFETITHTNIDLYT
jgi:hypothetical protein